MNPWLRVGLVLIALFAGMLVLAAVAETAAVALTDSKPERAVVRNQGDASPVRHFTVQQFDDYAYHRTKDEIRAEFGNPDSVIEADDSWFYSDSNERLAVTDPDAGVRVGVFIRFIGVDGPQDAVATVTN